MPDPLASASGRLRLAFATRPPRFPADASADIVPGAPWLAGATEDELLGGAVPAPSVDGLRLFERDGLLIGYGRAAAASADLAGVTRILYARVLAAAKGRHLYRAWHFVPGINGVTGGLEHYQAFCRGRSLAFEQAYGTGFERSLCAASAVGSEGADLELIFVAGTGRPRHVENPEQVPAYEYPAEHGPRPPSFARATIVTIGGRRYTFVSGTSSIKGHATVGGGLLRQLDCTLDNLRLISKQAGAGDGLAVAPAGRRHFKVYLRNAADLAATRDTLERTLLHEDDRVVYLRADICRSALDVEIEATLVGADPA